MRPKRSIATVCLSGTLPDKLEAAAAAGFDGGGDLRERPAHLRGHGRGGRAACAPTSGWRSRSSSPSATSSRCRSRSARRNLDRAERKFDTMEAARRRTWCWCAPTSRPRRCRSPSAPPPTCARWRSAPPAARSSSATRRWPGARTSTAGGRPGTSCAAPTTRRSASSSTASTPSASATTSRGLAEAVPAEKLFFVQLADAPRLSMDPLSWSRHFRSFPGQGELPVAEFLRDVLAAGYRGPLSLEIFNDEFRSAPARRIARDGLRCLVWAEEGAGHRRAAGAPGALRHRVRRIRGGRRGARRSSAPILGTPRLPPRRPAPLQGGDAAPQRRRQPRAERRAGQRRLRALRAARPLRLRHGLPGGRPGARAGAGRSACSAPPGASARARASGASPRSARRTARWSTWWRPAASGARRSGRTTSTSSRTRGGRGGARPLRRRGPRRAGADPRHDGQLLPVLPRASSAWSRTRPGNCRTPTAWCAPAPSPAARAACACRSTPRKAARTGTGRFVSAFAGAGVHHIAFCTADAAAATEAAAAKGAPLLDIPVNYYEDLGARVGLDDDELADLRRHHLLYDRTRRPAAPSATPTPIPSRTASSWRSPSARAAMTASAPPMPASAWRRRVDRSGAEGAAPVPIDLPTVGIPICTGMMDQPVQAARRPHRRPRAQPPRASPSKE